MSKNEQPKTEPSTTLKPDYLLAVIQGMVARMQRTERRLSALERLHEAEFKHFHQWEHERPKGATPDD